MDHGEARDDPLQLIRELRNSLDDLESRIGALEAGLAPGSATARISTAEPPETPAFPEPWESLNFGRLLTLTGRSIMVLAVAFLLRFMTDTSVLPPIPGVMLGVALGIGLILLVVRSSRKNDRAGAIAHGLTAVVIVYPLIFETVVSLSIIPVQMGAAFLAVVTAAGLLAAWQQGLRGLAWAFTLGPLMLIMTLINKTGENLIFFLLLLGLGAGSCLLAYTRKWHLMRWVVAAVLGLTLMRLMVLASGAAGGLPPGQSPQGIQVLSLAYMLVYLGIFSWRALIQGRGVKVFDVVQSTVAVAIGFGGAIRIARISGGGTVLIGILALLGAIAGYAVAFTVVTSRHGRGRGFFYFATLALVFLFLGSLVMVHGSWLIWCWVILGLAAGALGGRFHRVTLRYHAAIYLTLAAIQSGLLKSACLAFLAPASGTWFRLSGIGVLTFGAVIVGYIILVMTQRGQEVPFARRLPRLVMAVLLLEGIGYFAVMFLVSTLTALPPRAEPSLLALSRTLIIALTAIALAVVSRRRQLKELGWLVYPLLLLGCAKLLIEDLQSGTAITLALAFATLGGALILGPRLLRSGPPTPTQG